MKDNITFRVDKKRALLTEIKLCRERGGTFPEIAELFNSNKKLTLYGKEWTPNYMYRFFTENK